MQLSRKVDEKLKEWGNSDQAGCLLVRGARQIGKTFSIDAYGKSSFPVYNAINFIEQPAAMKIFEGNLDVDTLVMNFKFMFPGMKFEEGRTLLFLDEIQECPRAVMSLKFWAQDRRYKVIVSGSMLGIDHNRPTSFPVGSIKYLDMYALDFEEFLWAEGLSEEMISFLRDAFARGKKVPEAINSQMMTYLRRYMVIGGMPAIVSEWESSHDMGRVDALQRSILKDYRFDIAHYASSDIKIKAEDCYFSLPDQLSKPNHKFQYSVVAGGGSARKYGSSIDWLDNAFLTRYCFNVSTPEFPLRSFRKDDDFRLYPTDIGLLTGMYDYSLKKFLLMNEDNHILKTAKGGMYEALIADMLMKNKKRDLYFYKRSDSTMEIEFLLESGQGVIPVEVKAGKSRSRSLDTLLEKEDYAAGYKFTDGNAGISGKKRTMPLYMAMFL